ncbi:HD-GYP domain-containing protein [Desulfurivibrio sp. D14AmB]|uniref:HD-GYP domain-containing protein n=1 Tax=Desulfurivibrio sp. D14AmB TaxID=3374370 RepID=UPI00376F2278
MRARLHPTNSEACPQLPIDRLIAVVEKGGKVRTGVDVFNGRGLLLLEKSVLVADPKILRKVKAQGTMTVPIADGGEGGLWDQEGRKIPLPEEEPVQALFADKALIWPKLSKDVELKISEITEIKLAAARRYELAKECIQKTLDSIRQAGGEFDLEPVSKTVGELVDFVTLNDNSFAYLTREIFSYDDYLYNHSVNVCTIGTVIMQRFNNAFSAAVNSFLNDNPQGPPGAAPRDPGAFVYYTSSELRNISIGYFLHDLGKVMIDPEILNKTGKLTAKEFQVVKSHVTDKVERILRKNKLSDPHIVNVCLYHHAALYAGEERCYPQQDHHLVPSYVKVCKLADIYDAMTSIRCYKNALNPVSVVSEIFHHYARKDPFLQYVLHSFIGSVGIYPAGSVVYLTNGQLAYVLDSDGPLLLPLTDSGGTPLAKEPEVIVMDRGQTGNALAIDRQQPPISPLEAYRILPDYLRRALEAGRRQKPVLA